MPTITTEVSDLIVQLRGVYVDRYDENMSQMAAALGCSRPRLTNWLRGANGPSLKDEPALHRRIAMMLGVSPSDVLRLDGYQLSDEIPTAATVSGHLGPLGVPTSDDFADSDDDNVVEITAGTKHRALTSLRDASDLFLHAAHGQNDGPEGPASRKAA